MSTTEANEPVAADQLSPEIELSAADRCDACGAQAYVRVTLATGELLFCSHHANENKAKLDPIAIKWHDETSKLLAR